MNEESFERYFNYLFNSSRFDKIPKTYIDTYKEKMVPLYKELVSSGKLVESIDPNRGLQGMIIDFFREVEKCEPKELYHRFSPAVSWKEVNRVYHHLLNDGTIEFTFDRYFALTPLASEWEKHHMESVGQSGEA